MGREARTILTYGQVGDPDLPGFTAGVKEFAAKEWKTIEFDPDALAEGSRGKVDERKRVTTIPV